MATALSAPSSELFHPKDTRDNKWYVDYMCACEVTPSEESAVNKTTHKAAMMVSLQEIAIKYMYLTHHVYSGSCASEIEKNIPPPRACGLLL